MRAYWRPRPTAVGCCRAAGGPHSDTPSFGVPLIRSARSARSSLTTAWIVPAIGIASRAPISPSTAPPQSTAISTTRDRGRPLVVSGGPFRGETRRGWRPSQVSGLGSKRPPWSRPGDPTAASDLPASPKCGIRCTESGRLSTQHWPIDAVMEQRRADACKTLRLNGLETVAAREPPDGSAATRRRASGARAGYPSSGCLSPGRLWTGRGLGG